MLIGWRGARELDEPQHYLQGKILTQILNFMGLNIFIKSNKDLNKVVKLINYSKLTRIALIIKPNTFAKLSKASHFKEKSDIKRIDIINVIFDKIKKIQKLSICWLQL